jgi:hypothetical protein
MGPAVLLNILEEHLEEADFLWSHRQSALTDRHSTLHRLAEIEERLLAHLDGLVLSGYQVGGMSCVPTPSCRSLMLKAGPFLIASCEALHCVTSWLLRMAHMACSKKEYVN